MDPAEVEEAESSARMLGCLLMIWLIAVAVVIVFAVWFGWDANREKLEECFETSTYCVNEGGTWVPDTQTGDA